MSKHLIQTGNDIPAHQLIQGMNFLIQKKNSRILKQNENSGNFNFLISTKSVFYNDSLDIPNFSAGDAGMFPQVILRDPDGSLGWSCLAVAVHILLMEEIWLTSWYGKYPIIYMVLYIPGGCLGFLPQQYHFIFHNHYESWHGIQLILSRSLSCNRNKHDPKWIHGCTYETTTGETIAMAS